MTTLPVSILIPVYNAATHLKECIDSALAQGVAEIIVIDDGSTDGSGGIAQSYGSAVQLISRPNRGLSATLNDLYAASTQNWVQYLDADDFLHPLKISAQLDHQSEGDFLYCDYLIQRWKDGAIAAETFFSTNVYSTALGKLP
jgi:glycosyltransferase involved in cell wall biosynthesis